MRYLAVAFLVFGFTGCLEVDSPDGSLTCSMVPKRACPEGFYCLASSNTCWRVGHFPDDMADPARWMTGGPGDDMSISVDNDLSTDDAGAGGGDLSHSD